MTITYETIETVNGTELILNDKESGEILGTVVSALVPPTGDRAGFEIVLAQAIPTSSQPKPKIFELAEFESFDYEDLIRMHLEFQVEFKIQNSYAPITDSFRQYLRRFNENQDNKRMRTVHLSTPPHYNKGDVSYHMQVLKEAMRPESRRLVLKDSSKLHGYINAVPTNLDELTEAKHPGVAALAYAYNALVIYFDYETRIGLNRGINKAQTDYPLFPTRNMQR